MPRMQPPFPAAHFEDLERPIGNVDPSIDRPLARLIETSAASFLYAIADRQRWSIIDSLRGLAILFTGVQRRKAADDAGLALRDDQFRPRDDEHRRGDDGNAQIGKDGRQHGFSSERVGGRLHAAWRPANASVASAPAAGAVAALVVAVELRDALQRVLGQPQIQPGKDRIKLLQIVRAIDANYRPVPVAVKTAPGR